MSHLLLVGLGGALGAITRYGIDRIAAVDYHTVAEKTESYPIPLG